MSVFGDQLKTFVQETFGTAWATREGRVVPDVDSLPLKNEAVSFESATVLYADLAESTALVRKYKPFFAADIYKNYLYCAGRIIERNDGAITAYDGDRVMAVFLGDSKNSNAAKCALQINYAVTQIVQPAIKAQWPDEEYVVRQKIGIDTSSLFVAKTGVRGASDLVWVGNAANNAAKMAALGSGYNSYISGDVYSRLQDWAKLGGAQRQHVDGPRQCAARLQDLRILMALERLKDERLHTAGHATAGSGQGASRILTSPSTWRICERWLGWACRPDAT